MEISKNLTLDDSDATDSEDDGPEEEPTSYDAENYDFSEYPNDGSESYDLSNECYSYDDGSYNNYAEPGTQQWSCDTCEKEFSTYRYYCKHMSEHRTCGIDNCQFTAHEKIIEKHIKMQHMTGLYYKICKVSTPQDVTKWIEERKKKYPTKENIEKRYKQQEEMLKRGERIGKRDGRFSKGNNTRLQKARPPNKFQKGKIVSQKFKKPPTTINSQPVSLIDEKCDWNGTMFPFRGTKDLYKTEEVVEVNNFDDAEWVEADEPKTTKLALNNALGALIGAYNSSDDSDIEELIPAEQKQNISVNADEVPQKSIICDKSLENTAVQADQNSDDEPPLEEKIRKTEEDTLDVATAIKTGDERLNRKKDCGNMRNKPRKRFHRRRNNKVTKRKDIEDDGPENNEETCFNRTKFKKRRTTLLENLLDSEIRHERNVILQCVRFVTNNNFFGKEVERDSNQLVKY